MWYVTRLQHFYFHFVVKKLVWSSWKITMLDLNSAGGVTCKLRYFSHRAWSGNTDAFLNFSISSLNFENRYKSCGDFLAIFRNEITTILTPPISEGGECGEEGVVTFFVLKVPDNESAMLIHPPPHTHTYIILKIGANFHLMI